MTRHLSLAATLVAFALIDSAVAEDCTTVMVSDKTASCGDTGMEAALVLVHGGALTSRMWAALSSRRPRILPGSSLRAASNGRWISSPAPLTDRWPLPT